MIRPVMIPNPTLKPDPLVPRYPKPEPVGPMAMRVIRLPVAPVERRGDALSRFVGHPIATRAHVRRAYPSISAAAS